MGGETEAAAEPSGAILQSPQTMVWHCPPTPTVPGTDPHGKLV